MRQHEEGTPERVLSALPLGDVECTLTEDNCSVVKRLPGHGQAARWRLEPLIRADLLGSREPPAEQAIPAIAERIVGPSLGPAMKPSTDTLRSTTTGPMPALRSPQFVS